MAPDNFVQDPFNTQNFNRYGYVLNNPLMYTDPSGEFIFETSAAIYYGIGAAIMIGSAINHFWGENIAKAQIGRWLGNNLKSAGNDISRPFRETGRFFRRLFGGGNGSEKQSIFNPGSQILVDPALGNFGNSSLPISTSMGGNSINGSGNSFFSNQSWLSPLQTGLDIVGLAPVVGEAADGINALIYLAQGDYVNAGLSGAAMVPFLGWGATGVKLAGKANNAFDLAGVAKGVSVIGPRATYREFANKIGANFLNVTDEAWSMRKNVEFLQGVVKRGDDVIFSGKFNPAKLDPNSVLGQEIRYLTRHGYSWIDDFSRLIKK